MKMTSAEVLRKSGRGTISYVSGAKRQRQTALIRDKAILWTGCICVAISHVRFTPVCGRLRVGKSFLHICSSIGRCARVFGLFARHTWPLAIMPSADQVPNESPHSTMLGGKWVVLIARSTGSALRAARPPNLHITPSVRRDLVYAASATGSL